MGKKKSGSKSTTAASSSKPSPGASLAQELPPVAIEPESVVDIKVDANSSDIASQLATAREEIAALKEQLAQRDAEIQQLRAGTAESANKQVAANSEEMSKLTAR